MKAQEYDDKVLKVKELNSTIAALREELNESKEATRKVIAQIEQYRADR